MSFKAKALTWLIAPLLPIVSLAAAGKDLRLLEAVKNKDQAAIRSLLKQHVDVNAAQGDGATALFWAAHWDDLETADLLIRAGANVKASDDLGGTPLSLACTNRGAAMVERLLKAEANPKAALKTGETVLMTCVRTGNVDAVKSLLARGADPNAKESSGQTALMWSAAEKHPEVTRVLLDHGADVRARSKSGFTPLLFAARSGDLDSAKMLVAAGANVNEAAAGGMTSLLMASASGHEALSIFLAESGASPNVADSNGITPLHYALQKGISSLRDFGADEAFAYAFFYRPDMVQLVKALLEHGANPNARLVDHPAELEGSNHISWLGSVTPFLLAAATVDVNAMRALAAGGADARVSSKTGTTALMLVAGLGAKPQPLNADTEKNALEAVKLAVESGCDVNAAGSEGQTALHIAAAKGADTIVQFLVAKGAKVNQKNASGQTPLDVAEGGLGKRPAGAGPNRKVNKSTAELLRKLGGELGDITARGPDAPLESPVK